MSTAAKPKHIGRNISRIRELKDMKQEALAQALGTNQQSISAMENSEKVNDEKLVEVAKALGVSVEAIKNYSDEAVFNIIGNTFTDSSSNNNNYFCSINPLDKILELYERLLQAEKDKIEYLERVIKGK
ncbi:helix-turn-helix transcriptional regulator [Flavobacterium sp. MC2016-06]|jgi:transcriptional regulator with XRE-family HTH domain|uniref:helix-turn-helix domain-containing protein n=1 Tax=Flavobacterium sp. MC2016-06 TaxID=2676308 RepID=UPI0012BB110A|nr:helix-turn-helix transcriptional regulator [Flavobacterium sp. MC2016-06]MBU3861109.1 helix-turn-helix transcriptional regulator [Flavobacterium sp. MC2016-06]